MGCCGLVVHCDTWAGRTGCYILYNPCYSATPLMVARKFWRIYFSDIMRLCSISTEKWTTQKCRERPFWIFKMRKKTFERPGQGTSRWKAYSAWNLYGEGLLQLGRSGPRLTRTQPSFHIGPSSLSPRALPVCSQCHRIQSIYCCVSWWKNF